MYKTGDFPRAWALLLEFIETSALCKNSEVSLAALKSFQEMLQIKQQDSGDLKDEWKLLFEVPQQQMKSKLICPPTEETITRTPSNFSEPTTEPQETVNDEGPSIYSIDDKQVWSQAWKVWLSIGVAVTSPPVLSSSSQSSEEELYIPSQPFLTALIRIFAPLYEHIRGRFCTGDLQKLCLVLQQSLAVPVHSDATPFIMPVGEVSLTPLQEAVLDAIKVLKKVIITC